MQIYFQFSEREYLRQQSKVRLSERKCKFIHKIIVPLRANMKEKYKKRYLQGFGLAVVFLALIRAIWFPDGRIGEHAMQSDSTSLVSDSTQAAIGGVMVSNGEHIQLSSSSADGQYSQFVKHPVKGVRSYAEAFPDTNDLQLSAALQHGITPIPTRAAALQHTTGGKRLVYIGSSPFYYVDMLKRSVPYLVPRAASLLHDVGRAFMDSLQVKQVPLHRIVVSSVLRTKEDVERLRGHNRNATENSCHLYGTTFDISYNRYKAVAACDTCGDHAQSDTLKRVLSEVLRDMREGGRCYVKHERKQGCFHITVK